MWLRWQKKTVLGVQHAWALHLLCSPEAPILMSGSRGICCRECHWTTLTKGFCCPWTVGVAAYVMLQTVQRTVAATDVLFCLSFFVSFLWPVFCTLFFSASIFPFPHYLLVLFISPHCLYCITLSISLSLSLSLSLDDCFGQQVAVERPCHMCSTFSCPQCCRSKRHAGSQLSHLPLIYPFTRRLSPPG